MKKVSWTKRLLALALAVVTAATSWSIDWSGMGESIVANAGFDVPITLENGTTFSQSFSNGESGYKTFSAANVSCNLEPGASVTLSVMVYGNASGPSDIASNKAFWDNNNTVELVNTSEETLTVEKNLLEGADTGAIKISGNSNYLIYVTATVSGAAYINGESNGTNAY